MVTVHEGAAWEDYNCLTMQTQKMVPDLLHEALHWVLIGQGDVDEKSDLSHFPPLLVTQKHSLNDLKTLKVSGYPTLV